MKVATKIGKKALPQLCLKRFPHMIEPLAAPAPIVFRDIPLLVKIEQWIAQERGVTWRPEFEAKVDEVSVALFGIKRYPKPQQADFVSEGSFRVAEHAYDEWQASLAIPAGAPEEWDDVDWLEHLGIDIWDEHDNELNCAEWFEDQAIAAARGLRGAKFTPDGSGSLAAQDAEAWGAAFARDAANFRPKRR
ncbi:hypothetical protein M9978_16565 [Sphingomonas sp. MG17]|uniref:Uncharacterized protein n=1 Tax=Sphingomonas tagetis TaxID=2949092 RepID=A0A9X2KLZ0_9SPHN|nr:hypothetical protein [Sphingomonas tagetis]MCP3732039.1 hypothetical protein [Sphingomonas tagetis]